MSQSYGRTELPPARLAHPDDGPQFEITDFDHPDEICVSRSGNRQRGGKVIHVPDPTSDPDDPQPMCTPGHTDKGFRRVDAAVYPNRRYCRECHWGVQYDE
jgi:hypothetical protein